MGDWLFDDYDDDDKGGGIRSQQASSSLLHSQQHSQSKDQHGPEACVNCGFTDFYIEDATGLYVCSRCNTQTQNQVEEDEDDEVEFEDLQHASRRAFYISRTGTVWGNELRRQRDRIVPREAPPLPGLKVCIHGISSIIKFSLVRLCRVFHMSTSQHQEVKDIAKTLFFNYIDSWHSGAQKYQKIYPTMRFDFRDMFLPWTCRKGVHLVLLEHFIEEKQQEEQQQEESTHNESTSTEDESEEEQLKEEQHAKREEDVKINAGAGGPASSPRLSKYNRLFTKRGALFQKAITSSKQTTVGYQEAALLVPPDMVLAMCIVWLSVARRGVTLVEFLQLVQNQTLPFFTAFEHLSEEQQKDLKVVENAFRLTQMPSTCMMERVCSLVLLSGRVKSHEAFAGQALPGIPRSFRTLHEATIPVYTASLVSSMGMDTRILRSALSLMGQIHGSPSEGLPTKLHNINAKAIHSLSRVAAVVFCAIVLSPEWRGLLVARGDPSNVHKHNAVIPWTENQLNSIRNGPEFIYYLQYCQNYLQDCRYKSRIFGPYSFFGLALGRCKDAVKGATSENTTKTKHDFELSDSNSVESSHSGASRKRRRQDARFSNEEETSRDSGSVETSKNDLEASHESERVQPCPILAGARLEMSLDQHYAMTPFKRRILHSYAGQRRKHLSPIDRKIPFLDQSEAFLLEYVAFVTHSSTSELKKDLEAILS